MTQEEIMESLQKKKNQLTKEYGLISRQIEETIDESVRSRLNLKAKRILESIVEISDELEELNAKKPNSNRLHLKFQQNLSKIDFSKVVSEIDKLIHLFRKGVRGDALLLVQDSLSMAGELCITAIRERLSPETGHFNSIEFEFSPTTGRLDKIGFLDGLAKYLGIAFSEDIEQDERKYIETIIRKICSSLQGGSIVFLVIRKWDALPLADEELLWFVIEFWTPLINQLETIRKTHPQVKFISIIAADAKLSSECLNSTNVYCNDRNLKFIKLSLRKWNVNDIQLWLESYPGLQQPDSIQLAKHIHRSSKAGTPAIVCAALSEHFLK